MTRTVKQWKERYSRVSDPVKKLIAARGFQPREMMAVAAFQDVLGRDPDAAGFVEMSKYDSYQQMAGLLASSQEGMRKGADAAKYGDVVTAEEAGLAGDPYFTAWAEEMNVNPNTPISVYQVRQIENWQKSGDVNFMRASLRGQITEQAEVNGNQISTYKIVSPDAIATMGGAYTGIGNDPGDIVLLPAGTKLARGDEWQSMGTSTGADGAEYAVLGAKGHQTDGLMGLLGLNPDKLPGWAAPVIDAFTLNTGSSILGGGELHEDSSKFYRDTFGRDFEPYFDAGVTLAAFVGGTVAAGGNPAGGSAAAAGMKALQGTSRHAAGSPENMSDVWTDVAITAIPAGMRAAGIAVNTIQTAAITAAATKISGESWEKSLEAGAVQYATASVAGMTKYPALVALALGYGVNTAQGDDDALLAAAMSAAMTSVGDGGLLAENPKASYADRWSAVLGNSNPLAAPRSTRSVLQPPKDPMTRAPRVTGALSPHTVDWNSPYRLAPGVPDGTQVPGQEK